MKKILKDAERLKKMGVVINNKSIISEREIIVEWLKIAPVYERGKNV